ncbi:MAG: molybdate ABC transporter permease subunit, partial [Thiotrichales bacterium]|nr:molybdate ABC transporter permease subunit [Thiotrichales bacterium]
MLNELDISAIIVTIKLALLSTAILILIGTPLAWWLSQTKFKFKVVFEAIIALPLILPPTVLGFYLLVTLGSNGPIGKLLESLGGSSIAFTFSGLVVGSVIYSLPFVVQPLQNSFSLIGRQ